MKLMTLAGLAAASLIAAGAPALAQPDHWGGRGDERGEGWRDRGRGEGFRSYDLEGRIEWLQRRIDRGRDDGSLDRREAYRVQTQLDDIRHEMRRTIRRNGHLTPSDRAFLQARLDRVNDRIHWLRRNDDRRPW